MPDHLDHLSVSGFTDSQPYKSTLRPRGPVIPARNRVVHGGRLLQQLEHLERRENLLRSRRVMRGFPPDSGMLISLEIRPKGSLDFFRQLQWKRDGIEVLSAREEVDREHVNLFVPHGKLTAFKKRVQEYLDKDTPPRRPGGVAKPKNASLVNAIMAFKQAAFGELWTERSDPPPHDALEFYQVWLRVDEHGAAHAAAAFYAMAEKMELEVLPGFRRFPERLVFAVRTRRAVLEDALQLLDWIAEIRLAPATADFFLGDLRPHEQAEWIRELLQRIRHAEDSPFVTLLDTGVNDHPLLRPFTSDGDAMAANPDWGVNDHNGHGTGMAGICLYGDLTAAFVTREAHVVPCNLESVKILPPHGVNRPGLYGAVCARGVHVAERRRPERARTFAMMTTGDAKTFGSPTEWSATIDQLAMGIEWASHLHDPPEGQNPQHLPRLFVLSAGNVPTEEWENYPAANTLWAIQDPAQAWNALTVGACTDLVTIDPAIWPSLTPVAAAGALSPSSTTSVTWSRTWPFKPDVVAEGGNGCHDAATRSTLSGPDSVRQLTTSTDLGQPLRETGDTSAAAAEVARLCAFLTRRYPEYWPETIRGLAVHGAQWTPEMLRDYPHHATKIHKQSLLRRYGYGRINLQNSLESSSRRVTLVLQESMVPYIPDDRGGVVLGKMNLHELPWPADELERNPYADVQMRVTLSYFIEPNPSRRGWRSRFRYPSHGLRFAARGAQETDDRFLQRINQLERDLMDDDEEGESETLSDPDAKDWMLGAQMRGRGSLHCDIWTGKAEKLAQKGTIAVYPVGGWWKDAQRHGDQIRYALIITLEVLTDIDADLYSPIASDLGEIPVPGAG